jgi:hypothetical protein
LSFSVLAGSTVTNVGATTMAGSLGVSPGAALTGFPPGLVLGETHLADAVALQAESDLTTAYVDAAGRTPVTTLATELGGQTLTTGVFDSSTGTFGLTGTLTLDAEGDPNAVFVFHTASTLITGSGSVVSLINAAQACNVFWQIGSSANHRDDHHVQGHHHGLDLDRHADRRQPRGEGVRTQRSRDVGHQRHHDPRVRHVRSHRPPPRRRRALAAVAATVAAVTVAARHGRWVHHDRWRHDDRWGTTTGGGTTPPSTALTGFTAAQLIPWFLVLACMGMFAIGWARRMGLVTRIGTTFGFDTKR